MNSNFSKGFTLIELLVVISIIGLLSSVVLASLNTARAKANDATIKANLQGIRNIAELYYDANNGSYGSSPFAAGTATSGLCPAGSVFDDTRVREIIASSLALATAGAQPSCAIGVGGASWSLSVPLKTAGSWCIGSVGVAVPNKYPSGGGVTAADCGADTPPPSFFGGGGGGGGGGGL